MKVQVNRKSGLHTDSGPPPPPPPHKFSFPSKFSLTLTELFYEKINDQYKYE